MGRCRKYYFESIATLKIAKTPEEAYAHVNQWRNDELRIGLVLTMGALHEGHLSLVRRSQEECDVTLATIFVNPTQFGPHEDFSKYPRPIEEDLMLLQQIGTDMVFTPQREHLYPDGFSSYVTPPTVAKPLEGIHRPDHFRGVTTVVLKFFQILPATVAYFGEKDFQQLRVIEDMVRDLSVPIRVQGCTIVRESDGLAMSSRNRYLNTKERANALSVWKALSSVDELFQSGCRDTSLLEETMHRILVDEGTDRIDYAKVVERASLQSVEKVTAPSVALIAAHVGNTRLIDNLQLD